MKIINKFNRSWIVVIFFAVPLAIYAHVGFNINNIRYTQDFSNYDLGSTLGDNGWTSTGAPFMEIAVPSGEGNDADKIVRLSNDGTRRVAISPKVSDFNPGDTIFLSATVRKADLSTSGVAIGLRDAEGNDLVFFALKG